MTSNDPPSPAASGGRRRALGRGPGTVTPPDGPEPSPAGGSEPAPAGGSHPSPVGRLEASAPGGTEASLREVALGAPEVLPEGSETVEGSASPVGRSGALQAPAEAALTAPGGAAAVESVALAPAAGTEAGVAAGAPGASAPGVPDGTAADDTADDGVFKVRLSNFEGPFDLLLQLISRHKLDVTEVALSKVTDEFMAHIRAMGPDWDLDQTTEFLVVAATLLDLKAARLLPTAEVEDEADLALLEARDLLFARLLQYRAYKQIADIFNARLDEEARRYPRTVGLEAHHAELLPEVVISIGPEGFARLAVKAMQPKPKPQVYVDHIHAPLVSVQEQAGIVVARLRELGEASFRALVDDTDDTLTVVARFLALLELYREKAVALDQEEALGDLMVRWTGGDGEDQPRVTDEFDRPPETAEDGKGNGKGKQEETA
ncbi:segregation/condensation protein A [Streptomyces sp. NPDC007084]|uniref:segregation and condensation protein A n=1 Tax=Streptomyces sp. NPDC007084 TaxID=3154313 RepID=UPI003454BAC7